MKRLLALLAAGMLLLLPGCGKTEKPAGATTTTTTAGTSGLTSDTAPSLPLAVAPKDASE